MIEQDDAILIRQCLEGQSKSFEVLIDRYQKGIYNAAFRMLNNVQDAEDITQSVFIKAYENLNSFDFKHKFFNWIYRMAINESLNLMKQKKRFAGMETDYASTDDSPEEMFEAAELSERIGSSLMCLSAEYRILIILRHLQDLSYREVSYILEIPEKTVKSRLFTARQIFKDVLMKRGIVKNA
ncbi:MAG: sigma-70 family RNA polymerase sigma factor [bacterium]